MNFSRSATMPFPLLQFLQEQGEDKSIRRYVLNWDPVEQYAERNFKRFLINNGQDKDVATFLPTLPEPYDAQVKGIVFAIPVVVEREIRYFTRLAKEVWEEERQLPQELNDMTLEIALMSANVAFNVLGAYVEDRSSVGDNIVNSHATLYKFWNGQVNSGLVKRQAGFSALQERMNSDKLETADKKKLIDFSDAISAYEKTRHELFQTFVKKEDSPLDAPLPNASATQHAVEDEEKTEGSEESK